MDDVTVFAWCMSKDMRGSTWILWVPEMELALRLPLIFGAKASWTVGAFSRDMALNWTKEAEATGQQPWVMLHAEVPRADIMEALRLADEDKVMSSLLYRIMDSGEKIPLATVEKTTNT